MLARAIKRSHIYAHTYREYPSLIKGGHAAIQIDCSDTPIYSSETQVNIVVALNKEGITKHLTNIKPGGMLIHDLQIVDFTPEQKALLQERKIVRDQINATELLRRDGFAPILLNMYLLGSLWCELGLPKEVFINIIEEKFAKKPDRIPENITCFEMGYTNTYPTPKYNITRLQQPDKNIANHLLIDGAKSICLGLIASGTRAYFAYPMSPVSGILLHLGRFANKSNMLVKQAEDEITAAQMTLSACHMGTRAATATSGGGYDLMTETISLASITETPMLVILGQRPGPATGLPTWTGQGDLHLAVFAGHGDNPKAIFALSSPEDTPRIIASAWNIAEEYQIPVLVLADKWLLEDYFTVENLPTDQITIDRGALITDPKKLLACETTDRYNPATPTGVSPRWLPGSAAPLYNANGDEHDASGNTEESAENALAQADKRNRKHATLLKNSPAPVLHGAASNDLLVVGWGSTRLVMLDILQSEKNISYLHYEQVWPLTTEYLTSIAKNFKKVVLIEGNQTGQLGKLLSMEGCPIHFDHQILKYDGRPFFLDELRTQLKNLAS